MAYCNLPKIVLFFLVLQMSPSLIFAEAEAESKPEKLTADNKGTSLIYQLDSLVEAVLDSLVENNVLSVDQATEIRTKAIEQSELRERSLDQDYKSEDLINSKLNIVEEKELPAFENVIRVPFITETVKSQIREEVQAGLKQDAIDAIVQLARDENWKFASSTDSWQKRIKWSGDVRMRSQYDNFDSENDPIGYLNYQKINEKGGIANAGRDAILNTTEDRRRMRLRARLAMKAKLSRELKIGLRISTGNDKNPVSTNQTLGNTGRKSAVMWDQAYISYINLDRDNLPNLRLSVGRMPKPWYSTNLLWDNDLSFEGLAMGYQWNFNRIRNNSSKSVSTRQSLMLTLGAFPIQEVKLNSDDKWLYGVQTRAQFKITENSKFNVALAYYDYKNITGVANDIDDNLQDFTAPDFMQKGNSLFNIRTNNTGGEELFALASDYELINLLLIYDITHGSDKRTRMSLDYVQNLAFDKEDILERVQQRPVTNNLDEDSNEGYRFQISYGHYKIAQAADWEVVMSYRYLESDAVLDAFTDSDFHLGGTDAKGYTVSAKYGIAKGTRISVTYMSANEIHHPSPFAVDVLLVDVSARL